MIIRKNLSAITEVPRAKGISLGLSVITTSSATPGAELNNLSSFSAILANKNNYNSIDTTSSTSNNTGSDNAAVVEFSGIVLTPRLGFSDVFVPGVSRNDLYVTIEDGDWQVDRKDRNIELTIQVNFILQNTGTISRFSSQPLFSPFFFLCLFFYLSIFFFDC